MSLIYHLLVGPGGDSYSPSSTQLSGGSARLASMVRKHDQQIGAGIPAAPAVFAAPSSPPPYDSTGFIELALNSQAFGPLPTGLGVSVKDGVVRVNTAALEGPVEGGTY